MAFVRTPRLRGGVGKDAVGRMTVSQKAAEKHAQR